MNIIFFGSTTDSLLVLTKLSGVVCVVTQPPKPIGRKQTVTATPVERWAKIHTTPVLYAPDNLSSFKADLLISASYGEKIPAETIRNAAYGGLNVHPSLLPRWRGADPVPWAILSGDHQTGVSVITLADRFDEGAILVQKKIPIRPHDTTAPLRATLFEMGATLVADVLKQGPPFAGEPQKTSDTPYARRLTRDDGFEPWEMIMNPEQSERINRKFRAFHPWPGLWTMRDGKRFKILSCHLSGIQLILDQVQWEGKTPIPYLPI